MNPLAVYQPLVDQPLLLCLAVLLTAVLLGARP